MNQHCTSLRLVIPGKRMHFKPTFSNRVNIIDDFFPKKVYKRYFDLTDNIQRELGAKGYAYFSSLIGLYITAFPVAASYDNISIVAKNRGYNANLTKENFDDLYKSASEVPRMIKYPLESPIQAMFYEFFYATNLLTKKNKILILSSNTNLMEQCVYYKKNVVKKFVPEHLCQIYLLSSYEPSNEKNIKYFETNDIKHYEVAPEKILSELGNLVSADILEYDVVAIDFNKATITSSIIPVRLGSFQIVLPLIIIALQKIKKGGNLIMSMFTITKAYVLDLLVYISSFFSESYVYVPDNLYRGENLDLICFKDFNKGDVDFNSLTKLAEEMFRCDETGGNNFKINVSEDFEYYGLPKESVVNTCYLNNIFEESNDTFYEAYGNYLKQIHNRKIEGQYEKYNLYLYPEFIDSVVENNIYYTISYVQKYNIETLEWFDAKGFDKRYYSSTFKNIYNTMKAYVYKLEYKKGIKMGQFVDTHVALYNKLQSITDIIPIENTPIMKSFFCDFQKKLIDSINKKHDCNNACTNDCDTELISIVELYNRTKFFKANINYHPTFSSKTSGEINNITQSIIDEHNDKSFTASASVSAYVDIRANLSSKTKLSTYKRIIRNIQHTSEGGSMIINIPIIMNKMMMALMVTMTKVFESVTIFKPSREFWKAEIFIIAKGKLEDKTKLDQLDNILAELQKGIIFYPINKISKKFSIKYERHMEMIIEQYSKIKKFIIFLETNPKIFATRKNEITNFFNKKNEKWISKNL